MGDEPALRSVSAFEPVGVQFEAAGVDGAVVGCDRSLVGECRRGPRLDRVAGLVGVDDGAQWMFGGQAGGVHSGVVAAQGDLAGGFLGGAGEGLGAPYGLLDAADE